MKYLVRRHHKRVSTWSDVVEVEAADPEEAGGLAPFGDAVKILSTEFPRTRTAIVNVEVECPASTKRKSNE